ncbi:BTAD domain-containing putative transcriptional regulator [Streptomyces sp. NPDC088789]|uniref:AfsR/SARP family transcriptional regulator n=1 Tax=Streptomyces sp. NPDC088789 TaxID=3365899 RepID=UPI00382B8EF3
MNVQLLGCVEVRTAAGQVPIPYGARLLLAALAWTPNDFVADDTLIARVWEHRAPRHPVNALYTLATRLRKALPGPAFGERPAFQLARRRGGYVFAIDRTKVDLSVFRHSVQEARRAANQGQDELALRRYRDGLSLWRGGLLSDVPTACADAMRMTLWQEYREARVHCAEVGMRLGRHDECVPVLHDLFDQLPYDEKVAGLLMLALYRSGRPGEALERYRQCRARLIDQLGDGPGTELRALHDRILRRDAELGRPDLVGAAGARPL